jgi:uncharacterized protein
MSFDRFQQQAATASTGAAVDQGLQAHMRSVYNTMCLGLGITGIVAFAVANTPALFKLIFGTPLAWVALLAPLGFILFGFSASRVARMNSGQLRTTFTIFSAVMGLSMAVLFQVFTGASIARVFFITAGTFAAMSLYGYTTKRDLSGMGSFMVMGLIGIVLASLVNLFMQSEMVHFVVSVIGIVVFTGLTAWETQMLKETYRGGVAMAENNAKMAVLGALNLYMSFVNLFQFLLHFMGQRDN